MSGLPAVLGIAGYAASGKDTLAQLIAEKHGYRVGHFATRLRVACGQLNPIVGFTSMDAGVKPVRWVQLIQAIGYEEAKRHELFGPEIRRIQQALGTDVVRNLIDLDAWVRATMNDITPDHRVVFADVRFQNEVVAIRRRGGSVFRVNRPSLPAAGSHISERALDGARFDLVVANDREGDPEWMLQQVEQWALGRAA